ncbi:gremlin-1-like isoform X2 [Dermacentor albipictus]|uniref:gremlin-1-like isoform X2 n=1 Tax=Dermacentor albipictus TaxID=60249 RepID=UPI0038FC7445
MPNASSGTFEVYKTAWEHSSLAENMQIPEGLLLLLASLPLMTSSPAARQSAASPAAMHHPRRVRLQHPFGNGSPIERVLRSDGGPGLVLGRAIVVRDFRKNHHHRRQHNKQDDDAEDQDQRPRRDWCRTAPLVQRVWERGCHSALLRNRYCYGQCKSFYVPHGYNVAVAGASDKSNNGTAPSLNAVGIGRGGAAAFVSCAACKPVKFRPVRVTFVCPGQKPALRKRTFRRVHRCRCLAADTPT